MLSVSALSVPDLEPVSFRLGSGECVGLTGASGSGKSRLLRAVADLDPAGGTVTLDGRPRESVTGPQWRALVTLVPAESHWWADRIGAHFASPPTGPELRPLGLGTDILSRDVGETSSGERQRLALLRAIRRRPRVLLLDEPTASLDPDNVVRVEQWLLALRSTGVGLLWVSHDARQIARVAGRVLRVAAGRVAETRA